MDYSEILDLDINNDQILKILQQLIRIRTHQPQGDESDAVKFILSTIQENKKIGSKVISHGTNRSSLLLHIKGDDASHPILFMGHLDTIGVDNASGWNHYPYSADFDGNFVYGRGAVNKGGATAMIMTAEFLSRRQQLPCDVFFAFTADNDEHGLGAQALVEGGFLENIGEVVFVQPTRCSIGIAQKGVAWLTLESSGPYSHAAFPKRNADVMKSVFEYHKKLSKELSCDSHRYLGNNTCVITEFISKSIARYMTPQKAAASIDVRFLPSFNEQKIKSIINGVCDEVRRKYNNCDFNVSINNLRLPCAIDEDSPLVKQFEDVYRILKLKPQKTGISYLCDTSIVVPALGVPFVIIGPGRDIYYDTSDEKVCIEDIKRIIKIFYCYVMAKRV